MVKEVVLSCFGKSVSTKWCKRWVNTRKNELKERNSKYFPKKRAVITIEDEVEAFLSSLIDSKERFPFLAHTVINYDETSIVITKDGIKKIGSRYRSNINDMALKYDNVATLVSFISAEGKLLFSVYIFKLGNLDTWKEGKIKPYFPKKKYTLRGNIRRFYMYSETGCLNTSLFRDIMEKFCTIWLSEYEGLHCYVLGDQLAAHRDLEIVKMCFEKQVFLWSLPANTSHFLQPLDNACFAELKKGFRSKLERINLLGILMKVDVKKEIFTTMYEAEERAFQPNIIRASFRNVGLFPFDEERMRELTNENSGKLKVSKDDLVNESANMFSSFLNDLVEESNEEKVHQNSDHVEFLNSPQKLIVAREKEKQLKEEKKKAKIGRKRKREQEAREKLERRIRNNCLVKECTRVKQERSTWKQCSKCDKLICPKHNKNLTFHESLCQGEP